VATLRTLREKFGGRRKGRKRQFKLFRKTGERGHQRKAGEHGRAMRRLAKLIKRKTPIRLKALKIAEGLIGVMEQGGNNTGPIVDKIIRANGGAIGEPWCGDFVAYCYRLAGSKLVQRGWASVSMLGALFGIRRTSSPRRGDLVRFTFDHVGMFDKDNGDGTITTIEGNTGASGAVSDSATGGDGVYRKVREKGLVNDYLRVTR
jgi:hypothetical protein